MGDTERDEAHHSVKFVSIETAVKTALKPETKSVDRMLLHQPESLDSNSSSRRVSRRCTMDLSCGLPLGDDDLPGEDELLAAESMDDFTASALLSVCFGYQMLFINCPEITSTLVLMIFRERERWDNLDLVIPRKRERQDNYGSNSQENFLHIYIHTSHHCYSFRLPSQIVRCIYLMEVFLFTLEPV